MNIRILTAVAVTALLGTPLAWAAPRAESALECGLAADMAIVARSLAEEQIRQPQADAIMARIYDVRESERGQALLRDIIDAAYKTGAVPGQQFAEELFATCMKTAGNMDTILGSRL